MNTNTVVKNKTQSGWIRVFPKSNISTKVTLLCFPFAGGGANTYRPWVSFINPNTDVGAICLPGRESRILQKKVTQVDEVCDAIVAELVTDFWKKPIAFFCHSIGSMLAYEVAIHLQENYDWVPKILIASTRQAPHKKNGGSFHKVSDDIFINELKRLGGTPSASFEDAEMRQMMLAILRADYTLLETYRMKAKTLLSAPIVTCCGTADPEVDTSDMKFWSDLTTKTCTHYVF